MFYKIVEDKIERLIEEAAQSAHTGTSANTTSNTPTPSSETGASKVAQNIADSFKQGPAVVDKSPAKEVPKLDTLQNIVAKKEDSGFAGFNYTPTINPIMQPTMNDTLSQTDSLERLRAIANKG